ncbi:MAG: copper resistance protein CopC [Kineosporiaceae bacterium]
MPAPARPSLVLPRRALRAAVVAAALAAAGVGPLALDALTAAPAQAHARLVRSDPGDGARLPAAPAAIVLTFDDPVDARLARAELAGPGGRLAVVPSVGTGAARSRVSVALPGTPGLSRLLRGGDDAATAPLTLTYRVVSADGHPVSGRLRIFLPAPPAASAPASAAPTSVGAASTSVGSASTSVGSASTSVGSAPSAPSASATHSAGMSLPGAGPARGDGVPAWGVLALGVLALAAGALVVTRRLSGWRADDVDPPAGPPHGQDPR